MSHPHSPRHTSLKAQSPSSPTPNTNRNTDSHFIAVADNLDATLHALNTKYDSHRERLTQPAGSDNKPVSDAANASLASIHQHSQLYQDDINRLKAEYQRKSRESKLNTQRINAMMDSLKELTRAKQALEQQLARQQKQIREQKGLRMQLDATNDKLARAEQEIRTLDQQLNVASRDSHNKRRMLTQAKEIETQLESTNQDNHQLAGELKLLQDQNKALQEQYDAIARDNHGLKQQSEEVNQRFKAMLDDEKRLREEIERLKKEKAVAVKAYQQMKQRHEKRLNEKQLEDNLKRDFNQERQSNASIQKELQAEIAKLKKVIRQYKSQQG